MQYFTLIFTSNSHEFNFKKLNFTFHIDFIFVNHDYYRVGRINYKLQISRSVVQYFKIQQLSLTSSIYCFDTFTNQTLSSQFSIWIQLQFIDHLNRHTRFQIINSRINFKFAQSITKLTNWKLYFKFEKFNRFSSFQQVWYNIKFSIIRISESENIFKKEVKHISS